MTVAQVAGRTFIFNVRPDFKVLPTTCCKKPFGPIFEEKKLNALKICKPSRKFIEWANSYKINTLQQKDFGNFINETNPTTAKELCAAGLFMECVFNELEIMNASGSIDMTALSNQLNAMNVLAGNNSVWRTTIFNMISPIDPYWSSTYMFTDIVEDRFEKISCSGADVNLVPLIMTIMIQSEFIWMCPEQQYYNSKNKCRETMKNYQYCDGKIYSSLAKGIFYFP